MAEIIKLGSLYFDGQPQETGVKYDGEQITFGPTVSGEEIQWVKANGLLIADRCVCTDVSWDQLDNQGLVFGTPIQIDGQFYLCRCLKVGAENGVPNEWDSDMDEIGESNDLWHWENTYFWGQEAPPALSSRRAARGYRSARFWDYFSTSLRDINVGFRPVLEPLGSEPRNPDALIGKTIQVYGPRSVSLEGLLLDVDDYDFTLTPVASTPTDCLWASMAGDNLVVSRDSVLWLKET